MPQGTSIRTPDYAQDDEYKALLAQIAAFSPAAMMKQSNVIQSQERIESRHQDTQARLARTEEKVSDASKLGTIKDIAEEFVNDGNEGHLTQMFGGELFVSDEDGTIQFADNAAEVLGVNKENFKVTGEALNLTLRKNGSKRRQQNIFNQSVGSGLFKWLSPGTPGVGDVATKTTTLGAGAQKLKASPFYPSSYKDQSGKIIALTINSFDINDFDQIRSYALNPKMGKELYAAWLHHNDKWDRLSPINSNGLSYRQSYPDEYNRMDRVMRLIRNMNEMPPGLAQQMMDDTHVGRQDVIPEILGGQEPGAVISAETQELVHPEGYDSKLKNISNQINLIQTNPIFVASKNADPDKAYMRLLSLNQWGEASERKSVEQIEAEVTKPGVKLKWLHPSRFGEDGFPLEMDTPIKEALQEYDMEANNYRKSLGSLYGQVGVLSDEKAVYQRGSGMSLPQQFKQDNQLAKTTPGAGMYTSLPQESLEEGLLAHGGFSFKSEKDSPKSLTDSGWSKLIPTHQREFIFYGDKKDPTSKKRNDNQPYVMMDKLTKVWMNDFLKKNMHSYRLLGRGMDKWETISQSKEFRDFVKNKMETDEDYKEIIRLNVELIEEQKISKAVTKQGDKLAVVDKNGIRQHMSGTLYGTYPVDGKPTVVEIDLNNLSNDGAMRRITFTKPGPGAGGKPIIESRWLPKPEIDGFIKDHYNKVGIDAPMSEEVDVKEGYWQDRTGGLFTVPGKDFNIESVKMYAVHDAEGNIIDDTGPLTTTLPQKTQLAKKSVKPSVTPTLTAGQQEAAKFDSTIASIQKQLFQKIDDMKTGTQKPGDVIVGTDTTGTAQPVPASTAESQGGGKKIKSDTIVDLPAGKEPKYDFGKALGTEEQRKTIKNKLNLIEKLIAKPTSKLDYNLNIQLGVLKKAIPDFPIEFTAELLKTPEGLQLFQEYINVIINSK